MRLTVVWIVALTLLAVTSVGWYTSNMIFNTIAVSNLLGLAVDGPASNIVKLLGYVNIAWGPIFCLLVLFWAVTYPSERDIYSY